MSRLRCMLRAVDSKLHGVLCASYLVAEFTAA